MTSTNPAKRNPKDYITVTVLRKNYEDIASYLEKVSGEFHVAHMGKFYDAAALEKFIRLKIETQKPPAKTGGGKLK